VAVIAVVAAWNMGRVLADRYDAVVAGAAAADDLGMVNRHDRRPHGWSMAVLAYVRRGNVSCRFARRLNPVVATDAIAKDVHMSKVCRHPGVSEVAIIAGIVARDVRRVLAGRRHAVVAADTIADDIAVVEKRWRPGGCVMTIIALVAGGNMCRRLTRCLDAVMARAAASGYCRMVHECNRCPCHRRVAISALVGRHDVISGLERRAHNSTGRVTTDAGRLCSTEYGAGMADFTSNIDVRAIEYKSSAEVVKRFFGSEQLQRHQDHQKCQEFFHCKDSTSLKELSLWQRPQS